MQALIVLCLYIDIDNKRESLVVITRLIIARQRLVRTARTATATKTPQHHVVLLPLTLSHHLSHLGVDRAKTIVAIALRIAIVVSILVPRIVRLLLFRAFAIPCGRHRDSDDVRAA